MKINVGTTNKIKIEAVLEIVIDYDFLKDAIVSGVDAGSNVADQPKTLAETILGAQNRARNSFEDCDLSIGIEDGLMEVGEAMTGFMNTCAVVFYDGRRFYLGLSAAFEYPLEAIKLVNSGQDINQAFYALGLTDDPKIGSARGAIGILTKDRWNRKETVKQALTAALIQLDNKQLYL